MELKYFVKSVLKDVVDAVEETRHESTRDMHLSDSKNDRTVEFDIAVSAENSSKVTGKAGVKVLSVVEGGGDVSKDTKNSSVSRIKFGVHIDTYTKAEEARQRAEVDRFNAERREEFGIL
jgi:hypothetical protein